jgi:HK97 family phage major capsid protein
MDTNTMKQRLTLLTKKAELTLASVERKGEMTDGDKADLSAIEKEMDALAARIERGTADDGMVADLDRLTHGQARGTTPAGRSALHGQSAGALFADATAEFFKRGGHRASGGWRTDSVDIPNAALFATTLTEGSGSGGALVMPDYRPGIVPSATRRIVVMDLLMPGTTTSNAVNIMEETSFVNAAAPTAEGAAKPESALVFALVTEPVRKIAHFLPVSDETLEDVAQIASYIDGRLRLGVDLATEDQLLNGNGTAPNLLGLLNRVGLAATVVQGASESVADAILRQIGAISTTAMTAPTAVIMNPADWLPTQIVKDSTGRYIGPSPFETPQVPTLWGLPVALTTTIAAKTAFVGAFATMSQFFQRGPIQVAASNSHQDFFVKNLTAIRAERRGALACYRPGAFGRVTLL